MTGLPAKQCDSDVSFLDAVHVISTGRGPESALCGIGMLGSRWTVNAALATCVDCLALLQEDEIV